MQREIVPDLQNVPNMRRRESALLRDVHYYVMESSTVVNARLINMLTQSAWQPATAWGALWLLIQTCPHI